MNNTIKNVSLALIVSSSPSFAGDVQALNAVDFKSKSTVQHSFKMGVEVDIGMSDKINKESDLDDESNNDNQVKFKP
jgi:hypothetical protein